MQWVVEAYALFLSALLLVGGALGDRFGRRRMFGLGMSIFAAASAWCGLSPGIDSLIGARALQGVGGALLTPGSLALISAAYSEHDRGKAIGTWSGAAGVAAAIGPVLGGWLIDRVSWRWAFFINLPVAAVALAILFLRVPESRDEQAPAKLDLPGAVLVTLGLGGVVYGLIESSRVGFGAPAVLAALAGGVVALVAFVIVEARTEAPMVPLSLFRSRAFAVTNVGTLLLYAGLGGALFFLPFDLIQIRGYSATAAGAALLPFVAILFVLSPWAGGLVDRHGARGPLVIGPAIAGAGFALLAVPGLGGSYFTTVLPGVVVLALGMSITIAPLTTTVMNAVETHHAGLASGINNAVSRAAGLLAVAVLSIVVYRTFTSSLDRAMASMDLSPALRRAIERGMIDLAAMELPADTPRRVRAALEGEIDRAFLRGFRIVMGIAAGLALASAAAAGAWLEGKKKKG